MTPALRLALAPKSEDIENKTRQNKTKQNKTKQVNSSEFFGVLIR